MLTRLASRKKGRQLPQQSSRSMRKHTFHLRRVAAGARNNSCFAFLWQLFFFNIAAPWTYEKLNHAIPSFSAVTIWQPCHLKSSCAQACDMLVLIKIQSSNFNHEAGTGSIDRLPQRHTPLIPLTGALTAQVDPRWSNHETPLAPSTGYINHSQLRLPRWPASVPQTKKAFSDDRYDR